MAPRWPKKAQKRKLPHHIRVDEEVYNLVRGRYQKNTHRSLNQTLRESLGLDMPRQPAKQLSLLDIT